MPADPRPYVAAEAERRHGADLIADARSARELDAQRRALSPPTPIDRPAIRSVSAAYQGGFQSFAGG